MASSTPTTKVINPTQLATEAGATALIVAMPSGGTPFDATSPKVITDPVLTQAQLDAAVAAHVAVNTTANQTTINQRLANHRTQLLNWIAANPNGAVLTAAQTLILAQMLIDLTDADLGLLNDTSGT